MARLTFVYQDTPRPQKTDRSDSDPAAQNSSGDARGHQARLISRVLARIGQHLADLGCLMRERYGG